MSSSGTSNGINVNYSPVGARDGTRVVLKEITATLQNSPPIHGGVRKAASTTQPGKAEHEVKVQFTREFVDVGSSDSRPESLSSGSSFQSIASTFSTKSGTNSVSIAAQNVADTSYTDSNIPGLDDLIAACENIRVNDKTVREETERFQNISDSTLTLTTNDHSFDISNIDQNISQEEAYRSIINESTNLNGTNDVSSNYEEAGENSIHLNITRESVLGNEVIDPNSEPVKNSPLGEISTKLITSHSIESSNIPQLLVNNSQLGDTSYSSLKSDLVDSISLNKTSDLGPAPEQPNDNSVDAQACILRSDLLENNQLVNETILLTANCNSTINDIKSEEPEALNVTRDISHDNSSSIETAIDANPSNELLVCESNAHISALIDLPNLPSESSTCAHENETSLSVRDFSTLQNGHETESFTHENLTINEPNSLTISPTPKEQEIVNESGNDTAVQNLQIVSEICTPDSSTDNLLEVIHDNKIQTESALSSICVQESSQNISEELPQESIPSEEYKKSPENHNVSTTVRLLEDIKESKENCVKQDISTLLKPEELQQVPQIQAAEILDSRLLHLVSKNSDNLPRENFTEQPPQSLKSLDNSLAVLPLSEKIVPSLPQDSLHSLEKLEKSESVKLPQITGNVTPFPGVDSDSNQTSTLTSEDPNQNSSNFSQESVDQTITIKEESFHSTGSDGASENYNAFQPCKQSTSLNSICNFNKLEEAAQVIAEEIKNKSFELNEESDQFFSAEPDLFLDGASFDYLLTRTSGKNPVRDLRAESLYVKFDPLVNNASMLPQGPTPVVDGEENAKNSIPQPTLDTPKRNPALAAIDRLLFYSPATGTPIKVEEPPKIEEKIAEDIIIPEAVPIVDETMAKELELVRSTVLQLEKEKEEQEEELKKQRTKFEEIQLELAQEVQKKIDMTMVMDEYEKSLSRQLADRERERALFEQERAKLQEELQAANHHLGNTEAAFNDVHSKYERLKIIVSGFKNNEDILKETAQENLETIKTLEARYEHLKNHAKSQLEKANAELEAMRKQHETETVRLQAMIRKAELKSNSLAEMVEQKSKENKELTEILDEVIARVGRQPE
ncbi:transforming acidic coiled-coil-containing protein 3 isoform X1 [Athalia rosae]|uniref:transforming acidic coiled-coil-containing protein 3 isoform X1 n=1 Tax=Athalia rosae TaxID=37344 RepID=UPI002033B2F9|nr:transforming acidic coiled-coil-containing protein 3 isoform X1 [Athalia rosae]